MATSVTRGCGCTPSPASISRWSRQANPCPSASICASTFTSTSTSSSSSSSSSFFHSAGAAKNLRTKCSFSALQRARQPWRRSGFIAREGSLGPGKSAAFRAVKNDDDLRDDNAAINDMEDYLGDMSLEYDSVWDTKPAWCQPWTIITTGVGVVTASWVLFQNVFLTGGATTLIGLWWFAFLYQYPRGYSEMIAERRKLVEDGREDTYGRRMVE